MSSMSFPEPNFEPRQVAGEKSFLVTWLFSLFLGIFGADHFYLGKIKTGILKLVTFGGLGFWVIYDVVQLCRGKAVDSQGLKLQDEDKYRKTAIVVSVIFVIFALATSPTSTPSEADLPKLPGVVGIRLDVAKSDLEKIGVNESDIEVLGGGAFGIVDESNWTVCEQSPSAGSTDLSSVRLVVARFC